MPVEIVNKLATDGENSVELRLIIQNAAVLKGKRISGMLFLNDKELARISMKLHNTNISLIILCTCKKRHLVMVYRAKELEEHLRSKEVSDYLREFGYRRDDFISNLIRRAFLRTRERDIYIAVIGKYTATWRRPEKSF